MLTKPSTCELCPMFHKGRGFVPDDLVTKPAYAIVAEAPGGTEVTEGKPLVGKAGFVLKNWIMRAVPLIQVAYEQHHVSLHNVLRCQPPEIQGRPYPKGEEKHLAEAHCRQYLDLGAAHTVILCGESPQRFFFGPELEAEDRSSRTLGHDVKGVMGRVGRVYRKDGKMWVFAPHPAFVLRQPILTQHAQEAFKIATGQDTVVEPVVVPWETAIQELGWS